MTLTPAKIWLAFFSLWSVVLTGAFSSVVGAPGAWQAWQLNQLLEQKKAQNTLLSAQVHALDSQALLLQKHRTSQSREVRRVLGYSEPGALVFEFQTPAL